MKERNLFLKLFGIISLSILVLSGCLKEDEPDERIEEEKRLLEEYIEDNNITVEPTSSGLYYLVQEAGTGPAPNIDDYVLMNITISLIDEEIVSTTIENIAIIADIYDTSSLYTPVKDVVGSFISGLIEGLQLMNEGGKGRFIIPSDLAYSYYEWGPIPPYSTLLVDIELLKVIDDPEADEEEILQAYLETNNIDTIPFESGLIYMTIEEGEGELPLIFDHVKVAYTGMLLDGTVFDSGEFEFQIGVNEVIEGFEEGVTYTKEGGKARLIIPSSIGYGSTRQGQIQPYSTLLFDVEFLEFI